MRTPLIAAACTLMAGVAGAQTPVLTVYAPDYFASDWGPGPRIEAAFEAECGCDLRFSTGDILPRLMLEGDRNTADVAIGFTTDITRRARNLDLFAPHGQDTSGLTMPVDWDDDIFLPFNWSHTAFVYDETRLADPPDSFDALLAAPDDLKIVVQDPRTSEAGLALLLWVKAVYGDDAPRAWSELVPKVLTVTNDWSTAYGMFTEGEADMVLSFTTSPLYHLMAEGDATKKAAIFPEGHYVLAESAAVLTTAAQPELARDFMAFILSETFQTLIPGANYSFPVKLDPALLPPEFDQLNLPDTALIYSEDEAAALRDGALAEWLAAFGG